jgi:hypothetical protein
MKKIGLLQRISNFLLRWRNLPERIVRVQEALGRIEARQVALASTHETNKEFRVFSQWGEDGIIQYLIRNLNIECKYFIEFGVENYEQSNTRFLLTNNYWSGMVIDGSAKNIDFIKNDQIYWASNLNAVTAFIDRDNINGIFIDHKVPKKVGILSIDIDGNDYWIWESINTIDPIVVICEYNSLFGAMAKVTIPYQSDFVRGRSYPFSYYGASISALNYLAEKKGYSLVASNWAGNNVFFVKNEYLNGMSVISCEQAYRKACFRESKDRNGNLNFLPHDVLVETLGEMIVVDVTTLLESKFSDLNISNVY